MSDIVERLRAIATNAPGWPDRGSLLEAADEIERLGALAAIVREQGFEIERLQSCLYAQESVPALYAEIERLRAALEGVANANTIMDARAIAQTALINEPKP